jgi:hypothetical protein
MEAERVTASTTIEAAPGAVFAVLADPSAHADIDGTGWVRVSPGRRSHHRRRPGVPDGDVPPEPPGQGVQDRQPGRGVRRPQAIAWKSGTESPEAEELSFGGWIWRYDLEATGPSRTTRTLTYD